MKSLSANTVSGLVVLLSAACLTPAVSAQDKGKEREVYEATLVGTRGPVGGRSIGLTIVIEGMTSDQEVTEYLNLLKESKQRGPSSELRKRLEKVQGLGRISPVGSVGVDLAVVRERETDQGKLITLVTARNLSFRELRNAGRSTDYPYSFVQLLVDSEGKGQGTVIVAAKASFNEEGQLEIESYGLQPFQLFNVRRR